MEREKEKREGKRSCFSMRIVFERKIKTAPDPERDRQVSEEDCCRFFGQKREEGKKKRKKEESRV